MPEENKNTILGERLLLEGDLKGAVSKFKAALKESPSDPRAHFGKAEAMASDPKGDVAEIIIAYKKAIELDPKNAQYYQSLGAFYIGVGRIKEAEDCYNRAAAADPAGASYYFSELGIEYYNNAMGQMDEDEVDKAKVEEIKKTAMAFLLRSIDLTKEDAAKLLSK